MWTYSQLGYCFRLVRYHCVAVDYFKKMLELAWYHFSSPLICDRDLNNQQAELQAYDCIAMEYYYAGDLDKAKTYEERVNRGKLERKDSIIRSVCLNILASKREKVAMGLKNVILKK
jgi:hypothetical protein